VNLGDPKLRLIGPFDFEAVQTKHVDAEINLGGVSPDDVYVRDRVPISRWIELSNTLKGRDIDLPTIEYTAKKKRKSSNTEKKLPKQEATCHLCGLSDPSQELLLFESTPSQPTLRFHKSCGMKASSAKKEAAAGRRVISTNEVSELVEKTLKNIRQAATKDGTTYCLLDEFRAQLDLHLARIVTQDGTKTATSEYPKVYPLSAFDAEELKNMPVTFAYYTKADDPSGVSEMNAKIAKLDYDVTKRREKRRAREYANDSKKTYKVAPTKSRSGNSEQSEKTSTVQVSVADASSTHASSGRGRGRPRKESPRPTQPANVSSSLSLTRLTDESEVNQSSVPNDRFGLAEINETIGVLARIRAEKVREKRRISSGNTPQKKISRASPDEDVSGAKVIDSSTPLSVEKTTTSNDCAAADATETPGMPELAEPAGPHLNIPNLPDGWTMLRVPRYSGSSHQKSGDKYFFSPSGRKFRSKPEVIKFLACVEAAQGNEAEAAVQFQLKYPRKRSSKSEKASESGETEEKEVVVAGGEALVANREISVAEKMEIDDEDAMKGASEADKEETYL
jgi:hypothetical protein